MPRSNHFDRLALGLLVLSLGLMMLYATSRDARAADANLLALPSVQVSPGQEIVTSLLLTQTQGTVYAIDLHVTFDPHVVSAVSVQKGSAVSSWSLASNLVTPGEIVIGLATGTSPLTNGGELIKLTFLADDDIGASALVLAQGDLNEGDIPATLLNGIIVVNTLPVAVNDAYDVDEDGVLAVVEAEGTLDNDSDADGDSLTTVQLTAPVHGALSLDADGSFVYTPDDDYFGGDSFTYRAADGQGGGAVATVGITVNPINDNPVANAGGPYVVGAGASVSLDARGSSDVDDDAADLIYKWDLDDNGDFEITGVMPIFDASLLSPSVVNIHLQVEDDDNAVSGVVSTTVTIQSIAAYTVSGQASYWNEDRPLANVLVATSGAHTLTASTQANGAYSITAIPSGSYLLTASKSDATSSITAYDAALVLRHVAEIEMLSGNAAVAADVNQVNSISVLDASLILQRSVGLINLPFSVNSLIWRFEPNLYSLNALNADQGGRNFVGLLFGDVSGNWGELAVQSAAARQDASWLRINEQGSDAEGNQVFTIEVAQTIPELYAVSVDLTYAAAEGTVLHVSPVVEGWLFAHNASTSGLVKVSLAGTDSLQVGDVLLKVVLKPLSQASRVQLEIQQAMLNEGVMITSPSQQFLPLLVE